MILLVTGLHHPDRDLPTGYLVTPQSRDSVDKIVGTGRPWACDNGCYGGLDEPAYRRMLAKVIGQPGLLWVTVPDVVGDAIETMRLFTEWLPVLRDYALPLALVAQDGLEELQVPWDDIAALFIGGTTGWKLSPETAALIVEAKARDKWVHMGRVNSHRRIRYAAALGVDSIDGSSYSRYRTTHIPKALALMEGGQQAWREMLLSGT